MRRIGFTNVVVLLGAIVALVATSAVPASAFGVPQPTQVSAVPSKATPNINDGNVYSIAKIAGKIIVGGSFTNVSPPGVNDGSLAVAQQYLLAFDPATGVLDTGFAPAVDGTVEQVRQGPTPTTVYIGGYFNTVNGTKMKGLALLDATTGALVPGFKPPSMNGPVWSIRQVGNELLVGGLFTTLGGLARAGLGSVNPTTGALDSYLTVQLTGHHNFTGLPGQSSGPVGERRMDVSPDGSRLIVVGNFKNADGLLRDQIVLIDLGPSAASVDLSWATAGFSATCAAAAYDTYVRDVSYSVDGTYFVVATTGGGGPNARNVDGTRSLCDSASRFESATLGADVAPTWADYTGNDSFESVTTTGAAVYVGGHQRWVNNSLGSDSAAAGAVPRPGIVALDPVNGLPLSWNPGRNPRGAGAYSLLATADGLYMGSDTNYVGDHRYFRGRVAYFPLAGGSAVPSSGIGELPGTIYLVGLGSPATNVLASRTRNGSVTGPTTVVDTSQPWSQARGAFMVGNQLFYGLSDGNLYEAGFDGTTVGAPTLVDPYEDPAWATVDTGSGQTFLGAKPNLYGSELQGVTSMTFSGGRLYYTRSGKSALYSRYFTAESGMVGSAEVTNSGTFNMSSTVGMFLSGATLYYAKSDGTLHSTPFNNGTPTSTGDVTLSGPKLDGIDWRARDMFLLPAPAPTAAFTSSCHGSACTFDATASTAPGTSITGYAWNFGDGTLGTGPTPSHTYVGAGAFAVTVTVSTAQQGTATAIHQVSEVPVVPPTASVTASCSHLSCTVDGSASTAPFSVITGYTFDFGDATTPVTTPTPTTTHTYAAGGSYTISLTVTNGNGDTAGATVPVTVVAPPTSVTPIGSASTNGNSTTETVTIPGAVTQGSTLLLFATGASTAALTGPAGWTPVTSATGASTSTGVWTRSAQTGDAGQKVTVGFGTANVHGAVQLVAYDGTLTATPVLASAIGTSSVSATVATTPTITDPQAGTWVLSYWAVKSSTVTTWTAPSGAVVRDADNGSGSGRINALLADSGAAAAPGQVGGLSASTDAAASAFVTCTLILSSAGG